MKARALVFDFDGLLLETESSAYRSWCEIYGEHGCELPFERWIEYVGRESGWFDAAAYLGELVGRPLDREAIRARRKPRDSGVSRSPIPSRHARRSTGQTSGWTPSPRCR